MAQLALGVGVLQRHRATLHTHIVNVFKIVISTENNVELILIPILTLLHKKTFEAGKGEDVPIRNRVNNAKLSQKIEGNIKHLFI